MTAPPGLDLFGMSDVGTVRDDNEDHFLIAALNKRMEVRHTNLADADVLGRKSETEAFLLAVADGVGGLAGGELASGTAVGEMTLYVGHAMDCYYRYDADLEHEFIERLERAVQRAHEAIRNEFGARGPATTLTMMTLIWPRAYVVHVGDSRGPPARGTAAPVYAGSNHG